jgi:glycosyltransferase involved in cell wall biosynthesis
LTSGSVQIRRFEVISSWNRPNSLESNKLIYHISTVHPRFDNRIHYKECKSLLAEGYNVKLLIQGEEGPREGLEHISIGPYGSRVSRFFKGSREVMRKVRADRPDLIHFHDPELLLAGFLLSFGRRKVVYDVHEDLPKQLLYKSWIPSLLRIPLSWLTSVGEKLLSSRMDGIAVATDDIARKFPKDKTIVLRNFPLLGLAPQVEPSNSSLLQLIYAGGLTPVRGIRELIDALDLCEADVRLKLIGKWSDEEYEQECTSSPGWDKVDYLGYLKMEEVYQEIAKSDVGVGTLKPIRNYLTSLPVKAFEYMLIGKAMILSNFPYWKEIFHGTAAFVDPEKPEEIASAINRLAAIPEDRLRMGEQGRKMVQEEYNWEVESQKLLDLYNRLLS